MNSCVVFVEQKALEYFKAFCFTSYRPAQNRPLIQFGLAGVAALKAAQYIKLNFAQRIHGS